MTTKSLARSAGAGLGPTAAKSRRVRTGCLTCRERHLKCDEAAPDCRNCRKSNRSCKRGIRLNFLDIQVHTPGYRPVTRDWSVNFQDESRLVASEYRGGLAQYADLDAFKASASGGDIGMVLKRPHRMSSFGVQNAGAGRKGLGLCNTVDAGGNYVSAVTGPGRGYSEPGQRVQQCFETSPSDNRRHQHPEGNELSPLAAPPSSTRSTTLYGSLQSERRIPSRAEPPRYGYRMSDATSATSIPPPFVDPPPSQKSTPEKKIHSDEVETASPDEKPPAGEQDFLGSPEEVQYMQVFVREVGVWMDTLDKDKHFSEIIPYQALKSPMLLYALLACGVKHLSRDAPEKEDEALFYYNTATTQLLRSLQNPERDIGECAIAAVVLNVYEVMSDRPKQGMNHVGGARALIRECRWDATSTGNDAACFWLNVSMEVLSCLEMNWHTAWDPDEWELNMDMAGDAEGAGDEQTWVRRMVYIVARIVNFRASATQFLQPIPHNEQIRLGGRLNEWQELKRLCDSWDNGCPKTMHPMGYLYQTQSTPKSLFPHIWLGPLFKDHMSLVAPRADSFDRLIKREAVLGRLFYHTALCILAQTHPVEPASSSDEMELLRLHHAHQVCGIVAHVDDRSVAIAAVRALAVVAPALSDRREQVEALDILSRTNARSGWRLGNAESEAKKAWGWHHRGAVPYQDSTGGKRTVAGDGGVRAKVAQPLVATGSGVMGAPPQVDGVGPVTNPLGSADLDLPGHPYQNWYQRPSRTTVFGNQLS